MIAAARRLPEGDRYVRDGRWKTWGPLLLLGPDVHGATIGIVGFGRIGQAVARRAMGFGMTIVYHDVQRAAAGGRGEPTARTFLPLEELLARSDFVSLHVNLTDQTRGLIDAEKLGWMKPTRGAREHVARPGRRPPSRSPTRSGPGRSSRPAST